MTRMIDWNTPGSLKAALKKLGQRYDDLAAEANLSRSTVIRLANGKNNPNWGTMQRIDAALSRLEHAADSCSTCKGAQRDSARSTPKGVEV